VNKLGILTKIFKNSNENAGYSLKLITERGNGFYNFNGNLYQSDIIRACIRPKAKAIGKLLAKHIRQNAMELKTNPDPYMKFLLEEPNPHMTGQVFQEKIATQLALNNNAFALIVRDEFDFPYQIYPIPASGVEAKFDDAGYLYLRFTMKNGSVKTFNYKDIIHLRQDFNENDIFGDPNSNAIIPLMNVITTMDQGIIKAIKNSNIIRWILKFNNTLRPEDINKQVKEFTDNYLSIDSDKGGAVGADNKYDVQQVKPEAFVANAAQMKDTVQRIRSFFNTNEKIVQSSYTEDEWNSYYESEIEPLAMQMSGEYTRKLFTRRERGFGNSIIFEASNLQYASMSTKLNLLQMVDRGAMTPNEWRWVMNMGPIEGGEKPIRRLDTAVVEGGETINVD
jgi:HK97 family phage portal protein